MLFYTRWHKQWSVLIMLFWSVELLKTNSYTVVWVLLVGTTSNDRFVENFLAKLASESVAKFGQLFGEDMNKCLVCGFRQMMGLCFYILCSWFSVGIVGCALLRIRHLYHSPSYRLVFVRRENSHCSLDIRWSSRVYTLCLKKHSRHFRL